MELEAVVSEVSCLPRKDLLSFLASLTHAITIAVRFCYEESGAGLMNTPRVRLLNEVQHSVAGALVDLLRGEGEDYDVPLLVRSILAPRTDEGMTKDLFFCVERALGSAR